MAIDELSCGCLFCWTGKEENVILQMRSRFPGVEAIAPLKLRHRRTDGTLVEERVRLFPGYIFFRNVDPDAVLELRRFDDVLRLLVYPDDDWRLRGADLQLAEMLFEANGVVGFSVAYFDKGDRIHITEGFLKTYEGAITRVNRRARTAEVRVDFQGKTITMWLGFETMEMVQKKHPNGGGEAH